VNKITQQIKEIVELLGVLNKIQDIVPNTPLFVEFYKIAISHTDKRIEQLIADHNKEFVEKDEEI